MKFAVFTVGAPDLTPDDLLVKLKEYGYDGVEWRISQPAKEPDKATASSYWDNNLCTLDAANVLEQVQQYQKKCGEAGIEIAALGTYTRCNQYEEAETMLKAAASIGCKRIRVSPYIYNGQENYNVLFLKAREDYRALEKLAKQYGVKVNLEMHMGTITPSASSARRLVDGLDSDYIGVVYDVGNQVTEGFEQTKMGLELLGEYVDHVHIKNQGWVCTEENGEYKWASQQMMLNKGQADMKKIVEALKATGYDGYLSFEDFSTDVSTCEKLKFNIDYMKGLLAE